MIVTKKMMMNACCIAVRKGVVETDALALPWSPDSATHLPYQSNQAASKRSSSVSPLSMPEALDAKLTVDSPLTLRRARVSCDKRNELHSWFAIIVRNDARPVLKRRPYAPEGRGQPTSRFIISWSRLTFPHFHLFL